VLFDVPPESNGDIMARKVGAHAIGHLRTAQWAAEANVRHANALGFGDTIKVVWQLNGTMTYEDKERTFSIGPRDLFMTRSSSNYCLNVTEGYEALVLTFNAEAYPAWLYVVAQGENELVLKPSSAVAASAAGVLALLRQPHTDGTSERALRSLFELATGSASHGLSDPPSEQIAPSLFRARWLIRENISDSDYTTARLARDLGLSRRSLYNRFEDYGITPAAFIRMTRLEQAKREIEGDPGGVTALTTIALRNGFSDSSNLSRSIRARYGVTPTELRKAKLKRF
jgi:AraC family transcriptional regulator, positive regulator of tynA and feaB